jgi:curved DNA-binding protein CbpA
MSDNPYDVLGIGKSASANEIKKAYRKIARESHPDPHPGDAAAEARFKAAGAAFDLLKDPEMRARFDRGEIDASCHESPRERPFYRDFAEAPANPYGRARAMKATETRPTSLPSSCAARRDRRPTASATELSARAGRMRITRLRSRFLTRQWADQ